MVSVWHEYKSGDFAVNVASTSGHPESQIKLLPSVPSAKVPTGIARAGMMSNLSTG
jgi:hypothetical protein